MELNFLDIRDELYENIHNMKPKWWMRWGILFIFVIISLIFILAYIVRYPDTLACEIKLTTNKPSITFPLTQGTQIEKILIKNNSNVMLNNNILVLKNNANYIDVLLLEKELKKFIFDREFIIKFFEQFLSKNLQIGSVIENDWIAFSNELLIYYKIEKLKSYQVQIQFLHDEIAKQYQLKRLYISLIKNDIKQKEINDKRIEIDSFLYSQKVTSKVDYYNSKQFYFNKQSELEQNNIVLTRINLEITKLENAKKNFSNTENQSLISQQLSIRKALNKLQSSIEAWKRQFLIVSPINGKVSFLQNLEEGNFFAGNVLTIVPHSVDFYAKINIPINGAGKMKKGQRVIIKLNDYPYREYGTLEGKLVDYFSVADDKIYVGKVSLLKNNLTHSKVNIKENMKGVGEIITNDRSLLERVFENILYVFNKR
jgi:HlyD family secretion protein